MTASAVGYEQVRAWVEVMLGQTHATVVRTTAWIVLCVLVAQRVTAAALARALPADQAGSGRARLTRVRRWWTGPPLEQTVVSPQLIQAALTLLPPGQPVVVALDTTRLGPWEVWLAGIVVAGPYGPDRVGRDSLSMAQRPVPHDDGRAHPAVTRRLPTQRLVERGRGPGLSQCAALRPPATGRHRLQRAVAVECLGHRGGRLRDGR